MARTARVTYDELRKDLVEHYQATGTRDLKEAGWRLKHLDGFFRGARASQITAAVITKYIVQRQHEEIVKRTSREVARLQRKQVDLDTGRIAIRQSKTGQDVTVYLRPEVPAMLRAHVERIRDLERATDQVIPHLFPIFPGPGIPHKLVGTPRDNFTRVWARACAAAGFPGTLVHDLVRARVLSGHHFTGGACR